MPLEMCDNFNILEIIQLYSIISLNKMQALYCLTVYTTEEQEYAKSLTRAAFGRRGVVDHNPTF